MLSKALGMFAALWLLLPAAPAGGRQPRLAQPGDYIKVEIQGVLTVLDKVETNLQTLRDAYPRGGSGAYIMAGGEIVGLYISDNILKSGRELSGKRIVLTGTLVFLEPTIGAQRLSSFPLQRITLVQVTSIQAAEAK